MASEKKCLLDLAELVHRDFADKLKIDLTVVGPELPLTLGNRRAHVADWFRVEGSADGAVEFALQDHIILGYGDDAVERLLGEHLSLRGAGSNGGEQRAGDGDDSIHEGQIQAVA